MKIPSSPKKILSPVDFSERSEHAVRYAAALARRFESELILVHVLEPLALDYSMVDPERSLFDNVLEVRRERAWARLDAFAPEASGTIRVLVEGDAADQILCAASRQNADLIVMPTQGHSRIRRFIVGSVTAKVLHDSAIPVWTGVHLDYEQNFPEFRLRNVLCAIDFGPQSAAVLKFGTHLALAFEANVSVMHVISDALPFPKIRICWRAFKSASECSCAAPGWMRDATSNTAMRTKPCPLRLAR